MSNLTIVAEDKKKLGRGNWNLFVGDNEYKTDFILNFLSPFTLTRYVGDIFYRRQLIIKFTICTVSVAWSLVYYTISSFKLWHFVLGMIINSVAFCLVCLKRDLNYVRLCGIFFGLLLQGRLVFYCQEDACYSYIFLFRISNFVIGILTLPLDVTLVHSWKHHLAMSLFLLSTRFCLNGGQTVSSFFMEVFLIAVSTTFFSFNERNSKEKWCLYDSFKRAQRIYAKLLDQIPVPAFVTDSSGRIVYFNESGGTLCKTAGKLHKRGLNFLDIIDQEQRKEIEELIKRATRHHVKPVEVLLLGNTPCAIQEHTNSPKAEKKLGLDVGNIRKGYSYYEIEMKKTVWKANNCILITCKSIMTTRKSASSLLRNCLDLRERLLKSVGKPFR
eukprot:TRINITY_DN3568_c0_g3_i2.p1 TRINITY_DN3568_c0_g3~~TRINITY_DN3568_c0_g3_i2.p1  ORF type:complete len:386 (+),score=56.15 TRINITY_DN3568_c0_g3_i2:118-1275(+)